jgi:hypothetical protein
MEKMARMGVMALMARQVPSAHQAQASLQLPLLEIKEPVLQVE